MLSKEDFHMIKRLHERCVYQKDIAEELGVHPKTVSRALKRGSALEGKRKAGLLGRPAQNQTDKDVTLMVTA